MRTFYRALFWLVILPSLVFMFVAAVLDGLAWKLDAALNALEDRGWLE